MSLLVHPIYSSISSLEPTTVIIVYDINSQSMSPKFNCLV
jgi:hypothetical protein